MPITCNLKDKAQINRLEKKGNEFNLSQQVDNPPEPIEVRPPQVQFPKQQARFSMTSAVFLLILVSLLLFSSAILLTISAVQGLQSASQATTAVASLSTTTATPRSGQVTQTPLASPTNGLVATPTAIPPIVAPNNTLPAALQLPPDRYVIYEQQHGVYVISSAGGVSQAINTPGYVYNQAVRPILTPSGQLLYSGNGIWLTSLFGGTPTQIARLAANQVVTSMVLSSDGSTIAWSIESASGNGVIDIFAGPLANPSKVFEQSSDNCPCFRIFSFLNGSGTQGNSTLLLTDDQQSHESIQIGLWSFDLKNALTATPQLILDGSSQQGPLLLMPNRNLLLYSSFEGEVPVPTDGSVPNDVAVLKYPNSLDLTTLDGQPLSMDGLQVVLAEQHQLANSADYHWITTPTFTPDGHSLIYVEFSSQAQTPFDRSSALFKVQISGSGQKLHISRPQLMNTSTAALFELGPWFNTQIVTFYGDGFLYALDVQSGAVTTMVQTKTYARIIAVVGMLGV